MRKFWRTAESTVAGVKHIHNGIDLIVSHARIKFSARAQECFRFPYGFGKTCRGFFHFSAPVAKTRRDPFEDTPESRPAHGIFGRKIRPTEKRAAIGQKKSSQRPAALP